MRINLIKNILKVSAIVGIGATAYLSVKRADRIISVVNELKDTKPDDVKPVVHAVRNTPKILKAAWPVLLTGTGTAVCILAMDRISYKQIAALSATCAYLAKNRNFLAGKIKEVVGEDKIKDLQKAFIEESTKMVYSDIQDTGNGDLLCIDGYIGTKFLSSRKAVEEGIEEFNHLLFPTDFDPAELDVPWEEARKNMIPNYANWNDLYSCWNLKPTVFGDKFGYVTDPSGENIGWENEIEFDLIDVEDFEGTGQPALIIMPREYAEPEKWYMEV